MPLIFPDAATRELCAYGTNGSLCRTNHSNGAWKITIAQEVGRHDVKPVSRASIECRTFSVRPPIQGHTIDDLIRLAGEGPLDVIGSDVLAILTRLVLVLAIAQTVLRRR